MLMQLKQSQRLTKVALSARMILHVELSESKVNGAIAFTYLDRRYT